MLYEMVEERDPWRLSVGSENKRVGGLTVSALIIAGLSLRTVWAVTRPDNANRVGEAYNIAVSVARNGIYGDAYFVGQGPTAHVLPISPSIAGLFYMAFGIDTVMSSVMLLAWCLLQVIVGYILALAIFRRVGTSVWARLSALSILCLLPIFAGQETFDFRYWEGALAADLGLASLLCFVSWDGLQHIGWRRICLAAVLAALTFFVSPPLGLGVYSAAAIFLWRNQKGYQIAQSIGVAALILAAVLTPWVVRNEITMGKAILLRDNFGLEFAIANYPGAVHPDDPLKARNDRIQAVHPFRNTALWPTLRREGEGAYADRLGRDAVAWAKSHPTVFITLMVRHALEFYFPRPWQFALSGSGAVAGPRSALVCMISLFGLLGLGRGVLYGDRRYLYVAALVLMPVLPYALIEPVPRYMYIVFGLLTFLASDAVFRAAQFLGRKRRLSV